MRHLLRFALPLGALASAPAFFFACSGDDSTPSVGSLERVGQFTVFCAGKPGSNAAIRALGDCNDTIHDAPTDFGGDDSASHVYAVVTLETRGEISVVDLSSDENNVLDFDPSLPGETPLPVGAAPVAVVASPKGTAVFVASADPARPVLTALPGERLRPCEVDSAQCDKSPPTLSSWATCALSSAPSDLVMLADPPDASGNVRVACAGDYQAVDGEGAAYGDLDREGFGRQLLYVTLPREGRIAVIDAQNLLSSAPGEVADCVELASVTMGTQVPPIEPEDFVDTPACGLPEAVSPVTVGGAATPAQMAVAINKSPAAGNTGGRVFVSDLSLPLIHIVDVNDVCAPRLEDNPLVATSIENPTRTVITSRLAVSPLTPAEKRYLYAIDAEDRSVLAFDVTSASSPKLPLRRQNPEVNPFQPSDRVRFAAAPTDVSLVMRDAPKSNGSQTAAVGTSCDPNPLADVCSTGEEECDLGTLYRATSDYEEGAGPFTLRGVFGMISLATGQVAVIDVEDFDAACRGPVNASPALGCSETVSNLETTDEPSCNVVLAHQPRAASYLLTNDDVGRHQPGIQTFPSLASEDGTVITTGPTLRAVVDPSEIGPSLSVGGDVLGIDPETGFIIDDDGLKAGLRMNLQDPRVHQGDQEWAISYQGRLPGFDAHVGQLNAGLGLFLDDSVGFCRRGVQSEAAVRDSLASSDLTEQEQQVIAARYADRLHITEPLFEVEDVYWQSAACTFQECRSAFGEPNSPTEQRELKVTEAFENELSVEFAASTDADALACCFPTLVDYEIRPGDEWIVIGGASGFVHNVIADSIGGECRPSCDPNDSLKLGRVRAAPFGSLPQLGGEFAFKNALFSLAIELGDPTQEDTVEPARDMAFSFITQASFEAMRANLTDSNRRSVQVLSMGYVEPLDQMLVTDGGLEGLILFPGDLLGDLRQFF